MIIGIAGHIDHGKTALLRALTADAADDDERSVPPPGPTVELGRAGLAGPDGLRLSFLDVPGDEKLVRIMVAGASGIDYALLVIAADEGVMPQTREHLGILATLGVTRGAVLITKIDRVATAWVQERRAQARALLAAQGLDDYDVLAVSALRGDGLAELREHLWAAARALPPRAVEGARFRMDLDHLSTLDGIGAVVEGSIAAGSVAVGDSLCLAHQPAARYRVRSLHRHELSVTRAQAGQRCAIALAGLEHSQVELGQTLCDPVIAHGTQRVDVWLQVLRTEARILRSGAIVQLHAGTQNVMASVAVLGQATIAPGQAALAQLTLRQPVHLWWGQRFVLRDASAGRTLGGGSVLDVQGQPRHRETPERLAYLQSQRDPDPARRLLSALAHAPYGISGADWLRSTGLVSWPFDPAALPGVAYVPRQHWLAADEQLVGTELAVLAMLREFHARRPEDLGPDSKRARAMAAPRMPQVLWDQLLEHLAAQGKIGRRGGAIHLPAHGERLREADRVVAQRVLPLLQAGRFDPPGLRDLAGLAQLPEAQLRTALTRMALSGEVYQVVKDLYYHPGVVHELAQLAREIEQREGLVSSTIYRDATGLGRQQAVQILDFFDRLGYLRRVGVRYMLRPDSLLFASAPAPTQEARATPAGTPGQGHALGDQG